MIEMKETSLLTKQFVESHIHLLQWYLIARMLTLSLLATGYFTFRKDIFGGVDQVCLGVIIVALVSIGITGMVKGSFILNLAFASGLLFFSIFMMSMFLLAHKFFEIVMYIWIFDILAALWLQFRLMWDRAHGV